ncbi:MAG: hypothetical protein A2Y10_10160 [Planctomycetes bacterium GWF2_41_51]|nr:MAG: hypothetical protein A2Y10_10160 [Planctomycetes bacterium GWF2_41_51]HBG27697.1 hypothetical protein [Phycisphaerales bacterium]
MKAREKFVEYVKHGGSEPFVSFQIGAGAGFDCKLVGKEWVSEGTIDDTIQAYQIVECEPLFNVCLPEFGLMVPELAWQDSFESTDSERIISRLLETPYGTIHWKLKEQKKHGTTPIIYPLTSDSANVFRIVDWYVQQYGKSVKYMSELIGPLLEKVHSYGPVSIQWNIQPFELMGLLSVDNLVLLAMLEPQQYRKTCNLIRDINIDVIKAVFACDTDFIFLGAPGVEMLSPRIYEEFIIPDSQMITQAVHDVKGLVYSHICSPIEPFLSNGYYNRMGIDLFETLSPPPVGNVPDLAKARKILNPQMCTRGNIGLDVLLTGTTEQVEMETLRVLEATRGAKHMVAASDYLFYDIPLENVKASVQTVRKYKNR